MRRRIRYRSFVPSRDYPVLLRSEDEPCAWVALLPRTGDRVGTRESRSALWDGGGALEGIQGDRRRRAAQPARAHLRAAREAHRLQEDPRAAAVVRGGRPDLVRHRDPHRRDRPLGPGEGRWSGAVSSGRAFTERSSTSCGAATGRRARCAASSATCCGRRRRSPGAHGRPPTRAELASMMNMTPGELAREGVRDPQVGPHLAVVAGRDGRRVRHRADRDARVGRPARRPRAAVRARGGTRRSSAGRSSGSRRASARWRCSCTCRT